MCPKVSIVVPIYRVERYLAACVDSLLAQTLQEIEIILVDDGSPDGCGQIADAYAQADGRVKVIHQSNAGLGPARNTGIAMATGEYIGFVDSDDWVNPQMFANLYQAAKAGCADIVTGGYREITDGTVVRTMAHPLAGNTLTSGEEIGRVRKNLYAYPVGDKRRDSFPVAVWTSLYKREMIHSGAVRFQNVLSEDRMFNLDAYEKAKTVTYVDSTDYCYRKDGQASITQTFSERTVQRYQQLLDTAAARACAEQDAECVLRFRRMVIDYCRAYVTIVDNSNASFLQKTGYLRKLLGRKQVRSLWEGYPIGTLPFMQKVLHWTIMKEWYGAALLLNGARRKIGCRK